MSEPIELSARQRMVFRIVLSSLPVLLVLFLYVGVLTFRAGYAYYQFKVMEHTWAGNLWKHDPDLGYFHVGGFRGSQTVAPGVAVAVWTDEKGFRVPEGSGSVTGSPERPLVLSLGDSNVFGQACTAEENYAFLVARELGGTAINAGVSGYGLAQMVVLSRELIPRLEPDIVLAPHARYLWDRSTVGFAPTRLAAIPTPYLTASDDGQLGIQPPAHRSVIFDRPLQQFWSSETGVGDFLSFLLTVVPILGHNDAIKARLWTEWFFGRFESPAEFDPTIVRLAYSEMAALTAENGGRLVIWDLRLAKEPAPDHLESAHGIPGAVNVHPGFELYDRLDERTEDEYFRVYGHWAGTPPKLVDIHPNALAHRIIAEEMIEAIGKPADGL